MDRGRLKKMGKKSCFFVYKSGDADVEKKNPEINFVKALSAVCAVLLWRNAFLSVFDLEALANQIGRKEIIFAEIAVSFAVFILLIAAFKVRRLRVIAYLVIFAPFISDACARKFPPPWASWMLVFAAVLYGTCCAMEGCKAKQVFRSLVLISAVFGIAAGISVFAGKQIDQIRVDENGFYQETRQKIRENVIGKAEELAEKIKNKKDGKKLDEEKTDAESKHDREDIEEKNPFRPENDPTQQNGKNDNMTSGGKMDDLKAISSFKPSSEVSTCVVLEKKKTYLYDRWGTTYEDSAWTNEKLEEVVYSSKYYFEEEKEELFLQYPSELTRMQKMCEGWDKSSFSAVKNQIDEALSNIVYDTNPGKTPAKWDFAEYFLFENKKGFCVHFATTAALLYRMCGYQSIYVEGLVVPASAFKEKENGTYEAQVDGTMGHAWCEVYDEKTGEWITMEHTPASSRNEMQGADAAKQKKENSFKSNQVFRLIVCVVFVAGAAFGGVFIQAVVRGKRHRRKIGTTRGGIGILTMYDDVVKVARLTEKPKKQIFGNRHSDTDDYSEVWLKHLKKQYPQISEEEWNSFYEEVRRILFYYPTKDRRIWKESYKLYRKFYAEAKRRMNPGMRLLLKYIYCIETPFCEKGASFMKKKKKRRK